MENKNKENETNVESKEVAAELLKTETANKFKDDLLKAGASEESANDLMRHASFEAVEVFGTLKSIVRDNDGQIIQSDKLIGQLKQSMPGYFAFGTSTKNVAGLSEHHVMDILKQIEEGKIKQLDNQQKKAIRTAINSLENKEGGISIKRIGNKYSAMQIHRLCSKAGGLIQ